MTRVLVIGANGMLGKEVFSNIQKGGYQVLGTARKEISPGLVRFAWGEDSLYKLVQVNNPITHIVNCAGQIPQRIQEFGSYSINWELPKELSLIESEFKIKVIQIATDCVFDGMTGNYSEASKKSATDDYGRSKILGESYSSNFMNLRVSIIGNDHECKSLQSWLLSQEQGAKINGYTNHFWNGITTFAFAKVVLGIIVRDTFASGTQHLIPSDTVSKFELLQMIAKMHGRSDLEITPYPASNWVNRILSTEFPSKNIETWKNAGYYEVPTIEDLIKESARRMGFLC